MSELGQLVTEFRSTMVNWNSHYKYGCRDPFYSDGVNMNLLRNHMLYFKNKMIEIHQKSGVNLPPEYYLPLPPEVSMNYFADPTCPRAQRVSPCAEHKPERKLIFEKQLCLF